jgi:hypothetical protein
VASGGGVVGGGGGGAVGGGSSWPAVGEAASGEEDATLVGKRGSGARGGGRRSAGRLRTTARWRSTGEGAGPSQMMVGHSWTLVGHSWRTAGCSEGRRRSGTTAALGGKIWQPDGVVSYSRQTSKIFKTVSRVYIDGITTSGPHKATASGRPPLAGHIKQQPTVNLTTGG